MVTIISLLAGPDIPPVYLQAAFLVTKISQLSHLQEAAQTSRVGSGTGSFVQNAFGGPKHHWEGDGAFAT